MEHIVIKRIDDRAEIAEFAKTRRAYSPMLISKAQFENNFLNADLVLGACLCGDIVGAFSFSVIPKDRYLECLATLTDSGEAVRKVVEYLQESFVGFISDWVLSPNAKAADELIALGGNALEALFGYEIGSGKRNITSDQMVHPLSSADFEAYKQLHSKDCYWTAEQVIASGRFTVLITHDLSGYIDIFTDSDAAEVYDWQASDKDIKKALLKEALRIIDKSIFIMLEGVERQEMQIAEELGFRRKPVTDNLTIQLKL